ncbi:MAG: SDR family NAD(P)-dependent oxidoreductase [Acidobacteriota bacterium]
MRYADHSALVVGASGGVGRAIARELLDDGCDVTLGYGRRRDALEPLLNHAETLGRRATPLQFDLLDREAVRAACVDLLERFGPPSILVTCAGRFADRPLAQMRDEDWSDVIGVNLSGVFFVLRTLAPAMSRGGGRIVVVSSVSGIHGQPGQANYAAAEGGLIAMVKALARELGPLGVTVNAIAPGFLETTMTDGVAEATRRRLLQRIPLRRFGAPADVVPVARLLMAPDGGYVTGQVLVVDGGMTA